jgi:hypothetical protein
MSTTRKKPVKPAMPADEFALPDDGRTFEERFPAERPDGPFAQGVYAGLLYCNGSCFSLEGVGNIVYWQDGRGKPHCHLKDLEGNLIKPGLPITDAGQFEEILDPVIRYLRACGQLLE